MKRGDLFLHVEEHTRLAHESLTRALSLLADPKEGLTTWWTLLGQNLQAAADEIAKAQAAP